MSPTNRSSRSRKAQGEASGPIEGGRRSQAREMGGRGDEVAEQSSRSPKGRAEQSSRSPKGMEWPIGIALGLLTVVLVNIVFIYIATSSPPDVSPSYEMGRR